MYDMLHREPAFEGTSAEDALIRATLYLDHGGLYGYEYVGERPLKVLKPGTSRNPRDLMRELNWGYHLARKIEGGWEFTLVIAGD
jgi:hypothetical protein